MPPTQLQCHQLSAALPSAAETQCLIAAAVAPLEQALAGKAPAFTLQTVVNTVAAPVSSAAVKAAVDAVRAEKADGFCIGQGLDLSAGRVLSNSLVAPVCALQTAACAASACIASLASRIQTVEACVANPVYATAGEGVLGAVALGGDDEVVAMKPCTNALYVRAGNGIAPQYDSASDAMQLGVYHDGSMFVHPCTGRLGVVAGRGLVRTEEQSLAVKQEICGVCGATALGLGEGVGLDGWTKGVSCRVAAVTTAVCALQAGDPTICYTPEDSANKTTTISSASTDAQYPSAKAVYEYVGNLAAALAAINGGAS